MHITFFIGNGFDINLGLRTRYSDFYPFFIRRASKENIIKNWIDANEHLWSDLEEKLGEELREIDNENLLQFYFAKDELDSLLIQYLEGEQDRYLDVYKEQDMLRKEFVRSMLNFSIGLPEKDVTVINSILQKYIDEDYIYDFISFNYTNTLDNIVKVVKQSSSVISTHSGRSRAKNNRIGTILHIHGTTDEEMILGVNDAEQINNTIVKENEEFLDTFIKTRMNNGIGQRKTERAQNLIQNSRIICVFGMSIGNTDKIWWEELIKWLFLSGDNRLIVFWKGFEEALKKKLPARVIRLNNEIKNLILSRVNSDYSDVQLELIRSRIIVSYNANIFNFPKVDKEMNNNMETIPNPEE